MIHELKCLPQFFFEVSNGKKTFEVRRDDRPFRVDDVLMLREWNPETETYTGRFLFARVIYILRDKEYCKEGFCIMSIKI